MISIKNLIGIDLAKQVFQVHEMNADTGEMLGTKLKWAKFLAFFANRSSCLIGMRGAAVPSTGHGG